MQSWLVSEANIKFLSDHSTSMDKVVFLIIQKVEKLSYLRKYKNDI